MSEIKIEQDLNQVELESELVAQQDGQLRCCCGYELIKQDENTYRCTGGNHVYALDEGDITRDKFGNVFLRKKNFGKDNDVL